MPAIVFDRDFYNNPFCDELEKLLVARDSAQQILRYLEFWVEDVLVCRIEKNLLTAYWERGRKAVVGNKPVDLTLYKDEATKDGVTVLTFQGKYAQNNRVELKYRGPVASDKSMSFLFGPVANFEDGYAVDCFHLPVEYCDLV